MELYITKGTYKIVCAGCLKKVKISDVKKIDGNFYCPSCQDTISEIPPGKGNVTNNNNQPP